MPRRQRGRYLNPDRAAVGLAGRTTGGPGQQVGQATRLAQPDTRGLGVGEGDPAPGPDRLLGRWSAEASATIRAAARGIGWLRSVPERGQDQQHGADQCQQVHPPDHQDQLRCTAHVLKGTPRGKRANRGQRKPNTSAVATIGAQMATTKGTQLAVQARDPDGSRAARRLRRTGKVPGVVYGGGEDPLAFEVDARELRLALAHAGAVIDLAVDGAGSSPVVLKELCRHPVTGLTTHLDLLRVRLDKPIHSTVIVELDGTEDAPGAKEGGVLEQVTREVEIEALPNDIPDAIRHDVSEMVIGDTVTVEALRAPSGVTILTDAEAVIATLTPPRLQIEEEEIEEETELVGEGEEGEAAEGEEGAAEEASAEGGGGDEGEGGE